MQKISVENQEEITVCMEHSEKVVINTKHGEQKKRLCISPQIQLEDSFQNF